MIHSFKFKAVENISVNKISDYFIPPKAFLEETDSMTFNT